MESACRRCARPGLSGAIPALWLDRRAPSVNRLLGLLWTGYVLNPAVYTDDLTAEARDFYRRFYRVELDGEQIHKLMP
jgi:iron complex transport system substrate-binding protein